MIAELLVHPTDSMKVSSRWLCQRRPKASRHKLQMRLAVRIAAAASATASIE